MEYLYIQFQNKISNGEIALFRGAVINHFKDNGLFHNHLDEKFRYAYPLVQYKRMKGYAGLLGIGPGAEAIEELADAGPVPCVLGSRTLDLKVQSVQRGVFSIGFAESPFGYTISNWLPLNQENYHKFQQLPFVSERIQMLEKILVGNILSLAKGIGFHAARPVTCRLTEISSQYTSFYKGVGLTAFDINFQSNILLPRHIGLGKGASISHGVVSY